MSLYLSNVLRTAPNKSFVMVIKNPNGTFIYKFKKADLRGKNSP